MQQHAIDTRGDSFRFHIDVNPRPLSAAAERLMSRGRAAFKLHAAEPAIGDEVPGLSRLLGGGISVRRVQPSPEQLEVARGAAGSASAPPPPPRALPVSEESDVARRNAHVLQRTVAAGRGVPVTLPKPTQQELAKVVLQEAQRFRFGNGVSGSQFVGIFQHIAEQETLFRNIASGSKIAGIPARGPNVAPNWYSSGNAKGLLVDIGAVRPLTGQAFVESQVRDMEQHGFKAVWSTFAKPEYMRGVGKGAQRATRLVNLVGALHDGGLLAYEAPVLDADLRPESAGVPPLYGLDLLARERFSDSRTGALYCMPADFEVANWTWPKGTRVLQCEKGTSGHWLLGVDHWDKVDPCELRRVQSIRSARRPVD